MLTKKMILHANKMQAEEISTLTAEIERLKADKAEMAKLVGEWAAHAGQSDGQIATLTARLQAQGEALTEAKDLFRHHGEHEIENCQECRDEHSFGVWCEPQTCRICRWLRSAIISATPSVDWKAKYEAAEAELQTVREVIPMDFLTNRTTVEAVREMTAAGRRLGDKIKEHRACEAPKEDK